MILVRRGRRSWRLKYDIPRDADGRRQTRYLTLRGTYAQAKAEAVRILASVGAGTHVDQSAETVRAFAERYLEVRTSDISNRTLEHYATLLRRHIIPRLGNLPIQKLQAVHLQEIYAAMAAAGLSDRTRLQVHRTVHVMLKSAAKWG